MENLQQLHDSFPWLLPVLIVVMLWEAVWKVIALWKSARNNHLAWFICIAVFNTAGILPIVYILMQRGKAEIQH
ncbi:DUF5652 family protein [Saccharicrinis sp. FJH2]|uniref:DUF5652 family protein n=1 Tax=Saccharicrinis sp. FJH65 TaxID=3344659 RepID=UPI0035F3C2EF